MAETSFHLQVQEASPTAYVVVDANYTFVVSISLGMVPLLQEEAKLKYDLDQTKRTLRQKNIALEKALVDKEWFSRYFITVLIVLNNV